MSDSESTSTDLLSHVRETCADWVTSGRGDECFWETWDECPTEGTITPNMVLSIIARLSRRIVDSGPPENGDWACAQCKPHSEMIKDGFVCVYHEALRFLEDNVDICRERSESVACDGYQNSAAAWQNIGTDGEALAADDGPVYCCDPDNVGMSPPSHGYHNADNPHYPFFCALRDGRKVWRNDPMNGIQEWLTLDHPSIAGDPENIWRFGYEDLSLPELDSVQISRLSRASDGYDESEQGES